MDWDVGLLAVAKNANQVVKDLVRPGPQSRPVAELDLNRHSCPRPRFGDYNRLRRERNGSRSGERLTQPGEHCQVGVKLNPCEATDADRGKPVAVLQSPKARSTAARPRYRFLNR